MEELERTFPDEVESYREIRTSSAAVSYIKLAYLQLLGPMFCVKFSQRTEFFHLFCYFSCSLRKIYLYMCCSLYVLCCWCRKQNGLLNHKACYKTEMLSLRQSFKCQFYLNIWVFCLLLLLEWMMGALRAGKTRG